MKKKYKVFKDFFEIYSTKRFTLFLINNILFFILIFIIKLISEVIK